MNLEIKNLKTSKLASQETLFFTASLYNDGKLVATCGNQGCGGPTYIHAVPGERDTVAGLYEEAAAMPEYEAYGMKLKQSLDSLVDDLVYKTVAEKELKALLKKVLYRDKDGQFFTIKPVLRPGRSLNDYARDLVKRQEGVTVLNLLPFAEALKIWRAQ